MTSEKREIDLSELDEEGGDPFAWYNRHGRLINTVLVAGAVAFAGWRGYGYVTQARVDSANAALGAVQQAMAKAMGEADGVKRAADLGQIGSLATRVTENHAGQPAAREARLVAGNAAFYLAATKSGPEAVNALKNARDLFARYAAEATTPMERAAGQLALANTDENLLFLTSDKQSQNDAKAAYKKVAVEVPGSFLAAEAGISKGRMLLAVKDRQAEAMKDFEEVATARGALVGLTIAKESESTTVTTPKGQEISPAELKRMRDFADLSYQAVAKSAMDQAKGLGAK